MNDKTNEKRAADKINPNHHHTTPTCDNDPKSSTCNSCGSSYIRKIKVTRSKHYGPAYFGTMHVKNYPHFDEMIKKGILTNDEKLIICAVAANEGKLDTVQSYDNQALSAGAMQKTINGTDGKGEFPKQVAEFKQEHKPLYTELFELCGWTVEGEGKYAVMAYQDKEFTEGKKVTGSDFIDKFRKNCNATTFGKITIEKNATPLAVIIKAISTPEFQKKQIIDFIKRLHEYLDKKTHYGFKIGDYFKSNLGRATVLDHSVNTPGYVVHDVNTALDHFFNLTSNLSHNPAEWKDNHLKYEKEIIDYYGTHRRMSGYSTKHPNVYPTTVDRFNKLKRILNKEY